MKILSAIGARPQFIKAAPVSLALKQAGIDEVLVHSGQHYDHGMSQVFFDELGIPSPQENLGIGSGSHAVQTGQMLIGFEAAIQRHAPDWVLVHGDTNSTIAAALAAVKLGVRVAHNEAGLRSFNRTMPEEHNRMLTDHCADLLLCPTERAVAQLQREDLGARARLVGDVMYDCALHFGALAQERSSILSTVGVAAGGYGLVTLHRPYTVDVESRLRVVLDALGRAQRLLILPAHPRLREKLRSFGLVPPSNIRLIEPVGYLDMVQLERNAAIILTDSGGVQKEAYFHGVPCITLRPETEWSETVEVGWNVLCDADPERIATALSRTDWPSARPSLYGDGHAAARIIDELKHP